MKFELNVIRDFTQKWEKKKIKTENWGEGII